MSFSIYWEKNNVVVFLSGNTTSSEIMEANNSLYGDSRFDHMDYQIWDFLRLKNLDLSTDHNTVISTLDKSSSVWNNRTKVAFVAIENYHIESILDYKDMMKNTSWQIDIFENMDLALKWCKSKYN